MAGKDTLRGKLLIAPKTLVYAPTVYCFDFSYTARPQPDGVDHLVTRGLQEKQSVTYPDDDSVVSLEFGDELIPS